MAKRNRIVFWGFVSALFVAALLFSFWPRSIAVDTKMALAGPMSVSIYEEGETRVKDIFVVSAPVTGDMDRILLEPGDQVFAGETKLAAVHPVTPAALDERTEAQLNAALASAGSAVSMAKSELDRIDMSLNQAKREQARVQPLAEKGFASSSALDNANSEVEQLIAMRNSANAALDMRRSEQQIARSALMPRQHKTDGHEHLDLRAVIDGIVLQLHRESEGPIVQGAPILDIGNPRDLEIVVDLLSADAVRVSPGDKVMISGWGGQEFSGHVRLVEPFAFTKISALGIEEQRANVVIDLNKSDMVASLGHGYHVDVAIETWQTPSAVQIPLTTLFRSGSDWQAYVIDAGRASLKSLEIGEMNGQYAQVLSGLEKDVLLIEHPSARITNGQKVKPRNPG